MKKAIYLLLALLVFMSLFGCTESVDSQKTDESTTAVQSEKADIDLTEMSTTAMYAEVSNMQIYPDGYEGKTVKIKGRYNVYQDEKKTKWYYAVVIADATACCQQGMELEFADGKTPDYTNGDEIEVTGTFDTYTEKVQNCEILHCVLKNARIL